MSDFNETTKESVYRDEKYIVLQRNVLHAQGREWFLNFHGWSEKNLTVRKSLNYLNLRNIVQCNKSILTVEHQQDFRNLGLFISHYQYFLETSHHSSLI